MDPTTDFQRSAVIRDAALKAHLKASNTAALQRAALGRSGLPPKKPVVEGDAAQQCQAGHQGLGWPWNGCVYQSHAEQRMGVHARSSGQ
eukprot:293842-Karenia_brevis.AAC.1